MTAHDLPLRLGLSTGALYPEVATEDAPEVAARIGVSDLEAMLQTPGEYEKPVIAALRANAEAAGCRVHAIHTWQQLHPFFSEYPRRVAEARARFERAIAAANELGARVVVWHGPRTGELSGPDAFERFLAVTGELAAACGAAGVTLALENVSSCRLASVREVTAFAARLPDLGPPGSVGFAFDPFQAAEAGANPFMLLAAMGEHLVDVHLSDRKENDPAARHLPPGAGDLPWPALLRAIAAVYRGPMMVEASVGPDGAGMAAIRQRIEPLLRAVASRAGAVDDPCAGTPPPGVIEGIRLFNAGEFYECHEVIEHEWHAERGPIRLLYQGILQIGVGFHHARGGNYRGAVLLLDDGITKVSRFLPACLGIDTARLVDESRACLERITELGADGLGSFDFTLVPRVHLVDPVPS